MKRSFYSSEISNFLLEDSNSIFGKLNSQFTNQDLKDLQRNAWEAQIIILKEQLKDIKGKIYFEFTIPRMGKRVDNIIITENCVFVMEFKVGEGGYDSYAKEQVLDYTLDLQNFHEGSHDIELIPILIATNAKNVSNDTDSILALEDVAKCNKDGISNTLKQFISKSKVCINADEWENSIYKPTPTIVEAAQALYRGHNVTEISRSDSGAINLTKTANCLNRIIEFSKSNKVKSICFVTGVPGAGKTLAGLNIANERLKADEDEHAVFLSGNGPLVDVLREALARDLVINSKNIGAPINKKDAYRQTSTFIQNIHHFRDEYFYHGNAPTEKVVVFDEAQRAWNKKQASAFMQKRAKGIEVFDMSEPEFLVKVMDRHEDWCTIICLIGGGQEINTGEAGMEEWVNVFKSNFSDWNIHYSNLIAESPNYIKTKEQREWLKQNATSETELHLAVSIRSFRSEKLSDFVHEVLENKIDSSKKLFDQIKNDFPIVITRNLDTAKNWLRSNAKGSERTGLLISSGSRRLRAVGVDAENGLRSNSGANNIASWFLNPKSDVRSSYFLEIPATQFVIQGLELDWTCICWGGDLHIEDGDWKHLNFKGSKWMNIKQEESQNYLLNTYRVLLTRARQGMIIYIPEGSNTDHTRPHNYYDGTFDYLKEIGIKEI